MRSLHFLITLSVALLLSHDSMAEPKKKKKIRPDMTFGVKAGVDMQKINGGATYDQSFKPGLTTGVFLSIDKKNIGIRGEGLFKTGRFNSYSGNYHINTTGVEIPILFEVKLVKRVWLQVGPQFSSLISARNFGAGGDKVDVKNRFRNTDLSIVGGIEVALPYRLVAGARYIFGLVDVNNTSLYTATPETWRNKGIQIYVGYRFY